MTLSRFPHGLSTFGVPVLPHFNPTIKTGQVWWVDSVHGSNAAGSNGDFDNPFATINYAVAQCLSNNDDVIYVKEGHVEPITTAGGLTIDVAGITIVFLGDGSNRATISFGATTATMIVSAANVKMVNPRFLTAIDAVAVAINIRAADFQMYGAEYYDAAAKATTIQLLTTVAAQRMVIDGYKYFASTTGTQKTDGIKTVGALDGVVLKDIDINGDFSASPLDISAAITNVKMDGIRLNNTNSGPLPAATFHASTTGFAKNFKARVASGTTYISNVAKIQWADDCEGFNTDGYGGDPIGLPVSTGVEGKVDIIKSDLIVTQSDVKVIVSDLKVLDAIGDTIKSDLIVADALIDTIKSDLIVADALVDTIKSDLIITQSDVKAEGTRIITIASDLVISQSDLKITTTRVATIASDLIIADAVADKISSDLIVTQSDVKAEGTRIITIASDLVISQSDLKITTTRAATIASDLILVDTVADKISSDLVISQSDVKAMNTRTITIASDLVIVDTVVDKISSDLVADMVRTVTIASDLIVEDANVDTIKSDLIAFKTKYASDITALMSDLATKT